jgi:hypothetical protein
MNLISDFEAHKRDEDFDREDAKSAHVSHADRVAFADAMMAPPEPDEECDFCGGKGLVPSRPGPGGVVSTIECSCITQRYEP